MYAKIINNGRTRHYKIGDDAFVESGDRYYYIEPGESFPDDYDYRGELEIPKNSIIHVDVDTEAHRDDIQCSLHFRFAWWYCDTDYSWEVEGVVTTGELYIVQDDGTTFEKV